MSFVSFRCRIRELSLKFNLEIFYYLRSQKTLKLPGYRCLGFIGALNIMFVFFR